jgi:hypothetical protein
VPPFISLYNISNHIVRMEHRLGIPQMLSCPPVPGEPPLPRLREPRWCERLRLRRPGKVPKTTDREDMRMAERQLEGADAILAEARKTKDTAERMANGEGPPGEADDIRVLAGMVHQVAEQVERLASIVSGDAAPLANSEDVEGA